MTRLMEKAPRTFHLIQIGAVVAEGAIWSSGAVTLHHPGYPQSTSFWAGLDLVLDKHSLEEQYEVRWLDGLEAPVIRQPKQPERDGGGWPVLTASAPSTAWERHDDPTAT